MCDNFKIIKSQIITRQLTRYSNELRTGSPRTGVQFQAEARDVSLLHRLQSGSGATQPPIQWVPRSLCPEVKQQECVADRSPPSSAEVKNGGAIPPHSHTL
jgi:hypothetical protein